MSDIITTAQAVDGKVSRIEVDCNECDEFVTFTGDDPEIDAFVDMHTHYEWTGHTDYDVGMDVVTDVIDVELTIGDDGAEDTE